MVSTRILYILHSRLDSNYLKEKRGGEFGMRLVLKSLICSAAASLCIDPAVPPAENILHTNV